LKKILMVLLVVLLFYSCSDNVKNRKLEIAIIGKADSSYWNEVKVGAEAAGKKLGVKIDFYLPPKEDPGWQIRKLGEIISNSVDGIAVAPSDPKSITSLMAGIVNAEIPCIALDADVPKGRNAYIGTRDYYAGQQAAEAMVELLEPQSEIGIIADPSVPDFLQSVQGFKDIMAEHDNLKVTQILEKAYGDIQPDDVEQWIGSRSARAGSKISGIFCVSNSSGLAAARAVEKIGKSSQIKIVCIGESTEIMKAVRQNIIQVAVSRRPYRLGYSSVIVLYNMIKVGIRDTMIILPKSEMIELGVIMITPSNIDEYKQQLISLGIKADF
jgi:ribose transport system substrate-binding protein